MRTSLSRGFVGAALAVAVCVAPQAVAQTLRIPDFRERPAVFQMKPGEPCSDCGRVVSVREVAVERKATLPASFQGANRGPVDHNLVGAVVYLPLSNSSADKPFIGGVGTPEMRERFGETTYEMTLRMDDGSARFIERRDGSRYRVGDRVRSSGPGDLDLVVE